MKTRLKPAGGEKRWSGYQDALDFLLGLRLYGTKLGLNNIRRLLALLGNPHRGLVFYHVGGTNGKGSVAAILQALLMVTHKEVGLFTSPHLEDFRERIRINKRLITPAEVCSCLARIRPLLPRVARSPGCGHPTYFEVVTALACCYFRLKKVKTVVWEVGLGGRLDATNIVTPRVAVITNVALDHREYLGGSLREVTREKAGIIKRGVPLVTGETRPATLKILKEYCRRRGSPLIEVVSDYRGIVEERRRRGQIITICGPRRTCRKLFLPLLGGHQVYNCLTAFAAWERGEGRRAQRTSVKRVRSLLSRVSWPGRFEVRGGFGFDDLILDGAHNPAGARVLAEALKENLGNRPLLLILGVLADKDAEGICRLLVPLARKVIAVRPDSQRALSPSPLARFCRRATRGAVPVIVRKDLEMAFKYCYHDYPRAREVVCVAGSLYLVGQARGLLRTMRTDKRNNAHVFSA